MKIMNSAEKTSIRPGPRERLLSAARELTYTHGVGVGIDAILKEADVARRSLYQHFGGKDGLIVEVIRSTAAEDEKRYQAALEAGGKDPKKRLLSVFDAISNTLAKQDFRGCRYIAADLALVDTNHPAHRATRAYREQLEEMFEKELKQLGHADPAGAAKELLFLIEGALVAGANRTETNPGQTARKLAEYIIDG
jgi:AcrR family transcriptional regulator